MPRGRPPRRTDDRDVARSRPRAAPHSATPQPCWVDRSVHLSRFDASRPDTPRGGEASGTRSSRSDEYWKLPSGEAMFGPFTNELPEDGFVIQNFWNNANQHVVSDPFGT